jgi:hypothetical protein
MLVVAPRWKLGKLAGVAAVILGTLLSGAGAQATMPREVRLGRAPLRPSDSRALGRLSAGTHIAVLVTLKPQSGLAAYAKAVTTPGSSVYHHYLSVREFREQFGASQQTIDAVTDSLRASGLTPGRVSANGLALAVNASANKFSRAFKTSFERVRLPSGRVAFTNTSAPELSSAASPHVQAILGLNSLNPPLSTDLSRSRSLQRTSRTSVRAHTSQSGGPVNSCIPEGTAPTGTPPSGYWTADEVAQAYGLAGYYATGDEGAGQTIALVELEPNLPSDVAEYEYCYGLTGSATPTINYTEVDGGAGSGAGTGEAALDIEQVIGLAPQATVDVYQAPNNDTNTGFLAALQAMIDNSAVNIISNSWGTCEPSMEGPGESNYADLTSENVLFEQAATEGKTVFAASGDSGSSGCYQGSDNADSTPAADDPASQPYVTGTGGTSLPGTDETPDPAGQTVWNDGGEGGGAGGGGISNYWPMPAWQSDAAGSLNVIGPDSSGVPCRAASGGYCREVPDVSGDADPTTGYAIACSESCAVDNHAPSSGAWFPAGGTSAVAPLWAAYTALVNDSSICNKAPIGFANPLLYEAAGSAYASSFTDITTAGNNDDAATGYAGGLYPVGTGYDMATGLGTPIGGTLGNTLCDEADAVTLSEPAAQTTTDGVGVNLALTASDSEGHGISAFSASGLPAGLSINAATGAIAGAPTRAGRYNAAVTATASVTGAHTSKSFSWQVVAAPTTKTATFKLGDQTLTLTTPIQHTCTAPSALYRVKFRTATLARSAKAKLTFKTVAFYLDKGIKRVRTETKTVGGHKRTVKVTTYVPNATATHASSSESLHLKGLSRGSHKLKLVVTYTKSTVSHGKSKTLTVKKTITVRFKVC